MHRALRSRNVASNQPRDVHYFEDNNAVMINLRSTPSIDFDGAVLNIYSDISKETLDQRRALKPLLNQLRGDGSLTDGASLRA